MELEEADSPEWYYCHELQLDCLIAIELPGRVAQVYSLPYASFCGVEAAQED